MKKRVINFVLFGVIFIFLVGCVNAACSNNQRIMRLSANTNAHAELWNKGDYSVDVCSPSGEIIDHSKNPVIYLSSETNAHASTTQSTDYNIPVFFGDKLVCSKRTNCNSDEETVVSLSANTNAHLALGESISNILIWEDLEITSCEEGYSPCSVYSMAVYDSGSGEKLYTGHRFGHVRSYDGTSWTYLGDRGDHIYSMAVYDSGSGEKLYTGHRFGHVRSYDGTFWFDLGDIGVGFHINAMVSYDDGTGEKLYVGLDNGRVKSYDGTSWTNVGDQAGEIESMITYNDKLYVGLDNGRVNSYDGTTWNDLGDRGQSVESMAVYNGLLYIGMSNGRVNSYDGTTWNDLGDRGGSVQAMVSYDDGTGEKLYIGQFGGSVKSYDGTTWITLSDTGLSNIQAMILYDDSVNERICFGDFNNIVKAYGLISSFPIKICCKPGLGNLYWADMNEDSITEAEIGDTVKLIALNAGSVGDTVTFKIKDYDPIFPDEINETYGIVDSEGKAVATWEITQEDFDKGTIFEGKLEFYFEVLGEPSEKLFVDEDNYNDSNLNLEIISPKCGAYIDLTGYPIVFNIFADDEDDLITGEIDFGDGSPPNKTITNGMNSISHTYTNGGNFKVRATADSVRSGQKRNIINIMIIDTSQDGTYVAACIDKPEDLSNIVGGTIEFNAESTKAIRFTVLGGKEEIPPEDLKFKWTFSAPEGMYCVFQGNSRTCTDGGGNVYTDTGVSGYDFWYTYPQSGDNWATLEVSSI